MKVRFGLIGEKEVKMAKEKLVNSFRCDDGTWIPKKIWSEKTDTQKGFRGYMYDDVEEVLDRETIYALHSFHNIIHVEHFIKEHEYIFFKKELKTFKNIFKEGKTAYVVGGVISDDKESLCWSKIQKGQPIWKGTVEDAYHYLDTLDNIDIYIELIVMGVL